MVSVTETGSTSPAERDIFDGMRGKPGDDRREARLNVIGRYIADQDAPHRADRRAFGGTQSPAEHYEDWRCGDLVMPSPSAPYARTSK